MRWLVAVLALGATACVPALPTDVRTFETARRLFSTAAAPPAPDAAGWEEVRLPEYWGTAVRRRAIEGWYHVALRLDAPPTEMWAVYLPRVGQTGDVWVNGVLVGDGGTSQSPLPRNWLRPQLFSVPDRLLRAGDNTVDVHVRTHIGAPGYMSRILVAPERALRPQYESVHWWQVSFAQIVAATTFTMGLLLLVVSVGRHLVGTPWLAAGFIVWSGSAADSFVHFIPVSEHLWEWATGVTQLWATILFAIGFQRGLGLRWLGREAALLALGVVASLVVFLLPPIHAFSGMLVTTMMAVGMAIYITRLLVRQGRGDGWAWRYFLVPAAVGIGFGVHDILAITTGLRFAGVLLSPFIPAVALITSGWVLLARLVETLHETEALNRDLEQRVADKHRELERNYVRLAELERERAVADERERLMRDVHDGVGGQLVSTLALVESGESAPDDVAESIRAALEDLRLVIDSLDPSENDLLSVLGTVRSRLEPRLARYGLRFAWHVTDLPPIPGFGPEMALQAMRIVQEAVTNVVKHAHARTVTVSTGECAAPDGRAGVFVEVQDDGCGVVAGAPRGRGLTNMARRASRLGGAVDVRSDGAGTTVRLWLPCAA